MAATASVLLDPLVGALLLLNAVPLVILSAVHLCRRTLPAGSARAPVFFRHEPDGSLSFGDALPSVAEIRADYLASVSNGAIMAMPRRLYVDSVHTPTSVLSAVAEDPADEDFTDEEGEPGPAAGSMVVAAAVMAEASHGVVRRRVTGDGIKPLDKGLARTLSPDSPLDLESDEED